MSGNNDSDPPKWGQATRRGQATGRAGRGPIKQDKARNEDELTDARGAENKYICKNRAICAPFNRFLDIYAGTYLLLFIVVVGGPLFTALSAGGLFTALSKVSVSRLPWFPMILLGLTLAIPSTYLWRRWRVGWEIDENYPVMAGGGLGMIFGILFMLFSGGCSWFMGAFGGMTSETWGMLLVSFTIGGPLFIWGHYLVWRN